MRPSPRHFSVVSLVLLLFGAALLTWCSTAATAAAADGVGVTSIRQLQHKAWRQSDGAPGSINDMSEDRDGYLWLATAMGLYRFDGANFERVQSFGGQRLLASDIQTVKAFPDGRLFIGYKRGGVSVLENGALRTFGRAEGLPAGSVFFFRKTPDGAVWCGYAAGVARFDGARWTPAQHPDGGRFSLMLEVDDHGTVWANDDKGAWLKRSGDKTFSFLEDSDGFRPMVVRTNNRRLWLLSEDKRTLKEILHQGGRYSVGEKALSLPQGVYFDRLELDLDGAGWMVGSTGVYRLVDDSGRGDLTRARVEAFTQQQGLSGERTTFPLLDSQGSLWVGTSAGLDRFRRGDVQMMYPVPRMQFAAVAPARGGGAWIGTDLQGIALLHGSGSTLYDSFKPDVSALATAADGGLWVGDKERLWHFKDGSPTKIQGPDGVGPTAGGTAFDRYFYLHEDRAGTLWVSIIRAGVFRRVQGKWLPASESAELPRSTATAIASDGDGSVWLTYQGGRAFRISPDGSLLAVTEPDGMNIGDVYSAYTTSDHVWFGGERGLVVRDKAGLMRNLSIDDTQELSTVTGIGVSPSGELWLAELGGVLRVPRTEWGRALQQPGYRMKFRRYAYQDGLVGATSALASPPSLVISDDGAVWVRTHAGIGRIDPLREQLPKAAPAPQLLAVLVDGEPAGSTKRIEVPAGSTAVSFRFTAPYLADAGRMQFAYQLQGYDKSWVNAGARREATYTQLPPGVYEFRLKATTSLGVSKEVASAAQLAVAPFFWQTKPFFLAVGAMALLLLYGAYRLRLRSVAASVRATLEARTIERERIARDLHDTVLQGVTALTLQVRAAAEQLPAENPSKARLEAALQGARSVMREGRERLEGLRGAPNLERLASGALSEAVAEVCVELGRLHVDTSYQVALEGDEVGLELDKAVEVYSIAREALTNAFRHAHATRIEAVLLYGPDTLRLTVTDNGVGLSTDRAGEALRAGHFGLVGMRERARALGGTLEILEGNPGTSVQLSLPVAARILKPSQLVHRRRRIETTTILRAERHASTE